MDAIQKVRTLKINLILDPSPPLYALIHFWGTLPHTPFSSLLFPRQSVVLFKPYPKTSEFDLKLFCSNSVQIWFF